MTLSTGLKMQKKVYKNVCYNDRGEQVIKYDVKWEPIGIDGSCMSSPNGGQNIDQKAGNMDTRQPLQQLNNLNGSNIYVPADKNSEITKVTISRSNSPHKQLPVDQRNQQQVTGHYDYLQSAQG
jgi:hypothetical protein